MKNLMMMKMIMIELCENELYAHDSSICNIEEEFFNEDFENLQISFHVQSLCANESQNENMKHSTSQT